MLQLLPPETRAWIAYCEALRARWQSRALDRGDVTLSHVIWAAVGVTMALGVTATIVAAINKYKSKIH